jgi:hypothetical protein
MAEKNHRPRDDGLLADSSLLRSFKKIPELIGSCSKMFEVPRRLSLANPTIARTGTYRKVNRRPPASLTTAADA